MSLRPTRQASDTSLGLPQISFRLFACLAAIAFAVSCASTTDDEAMNDEADSEFNNADQDEVDVTLEVVEDTTISTDILNLETVYFDFDNSDIRESARPILRSNGQQLRAAGASVVLEGHCDERGDEEYNLALGERRATSVKRYLENLGVPRTQMRTLSYGEARPAVPGHDEAAWRYNRNVVFALP
jgi:peptidoglycan-associated lipoprotein